MVLILVVGSLTGWYVRQVRIRRDALVTIRGGGASISFVDQRPDAVGGWAWLYRWTGNELCREVDWIRLMPLPPLPPEITLTGEVPSIPAPLGPWDEECAAITRLGRVRRVDLFEPSITATSLAHLASSRVEELSLHEPQLTDALLAPIRRLHSLRALTISDARGGLSGAVVSAVADLTQLEELNLDDQSPLRSQDLAPLGALKRLRRLRIGATPRDESCLVLFGSLAQLRALGLRTPRSATPGCTGSWSGPPGSGKLRSMARC